MKAILFFALLGTMNFANAAEIDPTCYYVAESAVEDFAQKNYYDEGGITAHECTLASNKKAVLCSVGAEKGDGAAADTFLVVLNRTCEKVFRVELTGEE